MLRFFKSAQSCSGSQPKAILWAKKIENRTNLWCSRPDFASWGSGASTGPWDVTFWAEIENLCGDPILETFLILLKKIFCWPLFGLDLVKIANFWWFQANIIFLPNYYIQLTIKCPKWIWNRFLTFFCLYQL